MDEHPGRPAVDADNDCHAVVGYFFPKKTRRYDETNLHHTGTTNDNNAIDRQRRRHRMEVVSTMVLGIVAISTFSSAVSASFCDLGICGPGQAVEFPERLFSYTESGGNVDGSGEKHI
eukprot:scaffold48250_cov56-Attheya_sp.AAC.1